MSPTMLDDKDEWEAQAYPQSFGVRGFETREEAEEALPNWIRRAGPGQYEIREDKAKWNRREGYNWRIDKWE